MNLKELDKAAIAKRIQIARNSAKLSQEEFAELLGVTPNFVSKIECGVRGLSLDRLSKICQITGVSADFILFGKTNENSQLVPGVAEVIGNLSPDRQEFWKDTILKSTYFI